MSDVDGAPGGPYSEPSRGLSEGYSLVVSRGLAKPPEIVGLWRPSHGNRAWGTNGSLQN